MGQDGDKYGTGQVTNHKATVYEAAEVLGVTVDAIRKRIQRGTIPHERHEDGRVYVLLDEASKLQDNRQDATGKVQDDRQTPYRTDRDQLVQSLQDQVEYLRHEAEVWQEEARRKDHLLAAALERIPAAIEPPEEPPPGARESTVSASDDVGETEGPVEQERPSFWRRIFGVPRDYRQTR